MVASTLNSMPFKYIWIFLGLLLVGCQSLNQIGQEHAGEVIKWQELARYAGNELKPLGLTVTAGVQIEQNAEETSYSIIKVRLSRDSNNTEVDLLSPEFAEKFACGVECRRLGLYDSKFSKHETQLTSFFLAKEGDFFEFYGRLTRLNQTLAYYRTSSPVILEKYLTLMLNRKLIFSSLSSFLDYLEVHISEEKLLAFSTSGFISPVEDRQSSTFSDDVAVHFSIDKEIKVPQVPDGDWKINELKMPNDDWQVTDLEMPDDDWQVNDLKMPDDEWQVTDLKMPDDDWKINDLKMPDDEWDSNTLIKRSLTTPYSSWEKSKQYKIQVGSIACTFSDNRFGVVKALEGDRVTLGVIAQARVMADGMKLYPQPGYLFTAAKSFYFVKVSLNEIYPRSDIAACSIERIKRSQ